jgi:hypothetical protein
MWSSGVDRLRRGGQRAEVVERTGVEALVDGVIHVSPRSSE